MEKKSANMSGKKHSRCDTVFSFGEEIEGS